ncbi:hypothetical protein D9M68_774090 [compost metagenome]
MCRALLTIHYQLVAGLEAAAYQPLVADGAFGLERAPLQLVLGVYHVGHRLAGTVARYRLLRHHERLFLHTLLQHCAHVHAGQ